MRRDAPKKRVNPGFGATNLGSLAGAVVGSIGSLVAPGLWRVIVHGTLAALFEVPIIGIICFCIGGTLGWLIGGQIGPRIGVRYQKPHMELVGGAIGGLIPVAFIAFWIWYYTSG